MTTNWEPQEALDQFEAEVPPHECEQDGTCGHGGAFFLFVAEEKDTDEVMMVSGTHAASPHMVIEALIRTVDAMFLASKPDEMPTSVAWSHGRETLRRAIEEATPPPEISSGLADFITQMQTMMQEGDDE